MKKIFFLLLSVTMVSCSTYYQYDNTNRIVAKKTSISPVGRAVLSGAVSGITNALVDKYLFSSDNWYYYNGVRSTYHRGVRYSHLYNGYSYCTNRCTFLGRGHIHRYYQPRAYDYSTESGKIHLLNVTNQYYYGVKRYRINP